MARLGLKEGRRGTCLADTPPPLALLLQRWEGLLGRLAPPPRKCEPKPRRPARIPPLKTMALFAAATAAVGC